MTEDVKPPAGNLAVTEAEMDERLQRLPREMGVMLVTVG